MRRSIVPLSLLAGSLALMLAGADSARAQVLPSYVMRGIDSALSAIHMDRRDFSMDDQVPDDVHRLSVIKRFFRDPLASFVVSDSIAHEGLNSVDDPAAFFKYAGRLLDLGDMLVDPMRPMMTDAEMKLFTGIDMNAIDFNRALVLRRFLALSLSTDSRLSVARSEIDPEALARLVDFSDSLVLESSENADATLLELKIAERYGLARAKQFFNKDANGINYQKLLRPGISLYVLALDIAKTMAAEIARGGDTLKTQIWNTRLGKVAIGGKGDDIYDGDFLCIVDMGGNDVYRSAPRTKQQASDRPVSLIVDFSGNDTYIGGDFAFGGSLFGAGVLIDLNGDDNYSVGNFGLGCGYFGVGVVYDGAGSDRYTGGQCVEGAGLFGIGLLVDAAGNDNYSAHFMAQGFGYTRGIGGIVDREGNDNYLATSPFVDFLRYSDHFETFTQGASLGYRPVASAGIGFIAEGGGSDLYRSDIFGQGVGYWFGLGTIVDRSGNDSYNSFQYSQGSGVHLAFGTLIDYAGDDNYVSHGVSQGCGHDIGFGGLYDAQGDDNYVVESLSQGGGNADAISIFVDGRGEDGYIARRDNTMGYSDMRRMYGMIGIFLDLAGKDFYGTARGGNDTVWTGSSYGAGLDANFAPSGAAPEAVTGGPAPKEEPKKSKEEIEAELGKDMEMLFIQASAAPQKYQYIVEPARQRLVERADESIPYLLGQLNSESARERLALGFILPRFGSRVSKQLIDTVRFGQRSRVGMAIYVLGEMKDTNAGAALGERLNDSTDWLMRASAGEALLKMKSFAARPYLLKALRDRYELVRGRAARALALVAADSELPTLIGMLNDTSQVVRYQIQLGLQQRGVNTFPDLLVDSYKGARTAHARAILTILARGLTDTKARAALLAEMLDDPAPAVRADGVRLALQWGDRTSLRRAARLKGHERNSMVLYELYKVLDLEKKNRARRGGSKDEEAAVGKDKGARL